MKTTLWYSYFPSFWKSSKYASIQNSNGYGYAYFVVHLDSISIAQWLSISLVSLCVTSLCSPLSSNNPQLAISNQLISPILPSLPVWPSISLSDYSLHHHPSIPFIIVLHISLRLSSFLCLQSSYVFQFVRCAISPICLLIFITHSIPPHFHNAQYPFPLAKLPSLPFLSFSTLIQI